MSGFRQTASRTIANVGFTRLDEVEIEAPDGSTATRYALRLPNAVAVVPIDGADVVLIEQYRTPLDESLLEIPAGMLDVPGEDPEDAVRRELEEETGYTARAITFLTDIVTSPGVTDEVISLYVAEDIEPVTRTPQGPEERYATVVRIPFEEALERVRSGRIRDAKSVVALLLVRPP